MTTEINIVKIDTIPEEDPYHRGTGGQTYTELEIQSDGRVFVTQECDTGSTSFDVWNGVVLTAKLPHVNQDDLREYLVDNPLLETIVSGMDTVWDGSNHVGKHTDEALEAFDELVDEINSWGNFYCRWAAGDWLGQNTSDELGITAHTTDEEIETLAKEFEQTPEAGDVIDGMRVIVGACDIEEYLKEIRDNLLLEIA